MTTRTRSSIGRALLIAAAVPAALSAQTLTIFDGDSVDNIMLFEGSQTYGSAGTDTVYTNFFTEGGAGSGGGAGFGGVFFVNTGASLTLNNVSFKSNTVKGGEGGSPPPASVGGFVLAVTERTTSVAKVPDLTATPTILGSYGDGEGYSIASVDLGFVSPTYKAGFAAAIEGTTGVSSIQSISGTTVTLAQPLEVKASAIFNAPPVLNYSGGTDEITGIGAFTDAEVEGGKELSEALFIGRVLVGTGIAPGTKILETTINNAGRVTAIKLSKPTLSAGTGFDILKVEGFTGAQFAAVSNTEIVANASGLGLVAGMIVSGDGIPAGTTVVSVTPISGSNNSTIVFSNPINDGASTLGFKGTLPVIEPNGDSYNVIRLSGRDPRLQVGMGISGDGIAPGTTVTAIDAAKGTITLSQDLLDDPEKAGSKIIPTEFAVSNVTSQVGTALTMVNIKGLAAGMVVTGENVAEGTTIVSVNPVTKVVVLSAAPEGDVVGLTASSPLVIGGSLNNMVSTGTKGDNGRDGYSGRADAAFLLEGEGQEGTNGYNAKDGTGAAGGNGGNAGNGSNGMPFNWDLNWEVTSLSFDLGVTIDEAISAGTNVDETDPFAPHPDPDFGEMRVKIAAAVIIATDLGIAITRLTEWGIDMNRGLVARGGAGGDGGEAGNGDEFFGGGAGGAGGRGGEGGLSFTDGGDGGSGGLGGRGGFGAGGGSGGAAGDAGSTGQGTDGDRGDGGRAGFGAGEGSNGDGEFGGGGSGFGGSIFIRTGGTVTLTGNSVFENNTVLGGSSNNGGEAGQAAGTDIFLMKGADLYFAPGAGNTIRLEGTIADDSLASIEGGSPAAGFGATVRFGGGGKIILNGENTYSGRTQIEGATLAVDDGVGVNQDSHIHFAGAGVVGTFETGSLVSGSNTGALLTTGRVVRRAGTLPHQLSWAGAGGFAAATSEDLILNFGQLGSSAGQVLKWDTAAISDSSVIVFGSEYSEGSVRLLNSINMNESTGNFAVVGSKPTGEDSHDASQTAYLQGLLYNGSIEVGSAGMDGLLIITAQNELTGATFHSGITSVLGRLFKPGEGGNLLITNNGSGAGEVILWNDELILNANLEGGATLTAAGDVGLVDLVNAGTVNFGGSTTARSVVNSLGGSIKALGGLTVSADGEGSGGTILNGGGATFTQGSDVSATSTVTNNGEWTVVGNPNDGSRKLTTDEGLFGTGNVTLARATYTLNDLSTVNVDANLELEVTADGEGYYQGVISGPGSFTKSGTGDQELAGTNTFSGDLTVAAGNLLLTGTQADAVDVLVRSGANLTFGINDKVASVTVDNGGFAYLDANVETTNNYTTNGTTALLGSRTIKTGGGLAGSGLVSLSKDLAQTLTLDQAGASTFSGSIAGPGRLVKNGAGKLTLTGAADSLDLGGGVTINAGTIALDGAGILDVSLDIVINVNGTLELVNGDQEANSISGLGTINLGDGNTLEVAVGGDFEGNVIGQGVLKVAGGSLNVNSITSTSGTFDVADGAETNIAEGGTLEFPDLTVQGGGTLHLGATGNDPGTSNVNVSGTANIMGNVTGTGSLNGNTVTHSGSNIAPGNSPGIINFAGNLTIGSGTNFDIELQGLAGAGVNPNGHDQVQVGGNLEIESGDPLNLNTLTIKQLSGFELNRGQKLEIFSFTPGRVNGQFDEVTSELTNPVFYSLATGNVVGYGAAGRTGLRNAVVGNANQAEMFDKALVQTAGGVDQVYGGRLTEALAENLQLGRSTDAVFERSTAERHGSILAQARATLFGAVSELPQSSTPADGWGVRFSGGNLDSAGSTLDYLPYKVGRNTASVHHTSTQPAGTLTVSLGIEDGKVSASGYRADSTGITLAAVLQHKIESVKGLAVGLRAGFSRLETDTSRDTLAAASTADGIGSQTALIGAGIGYQREHGAITYTAGLELLAFRARVDGFTENNTNSLDSLTVGQQEDNGFAAVASIGLSGKVTERLSLGADLRLTSFGGPEQHNVQSSVRTEEVSTTVTHLGNGNNVLGLGLKAVYQLDPQSTIDFGVRFEGDGSLSDGARFDVGYRRNF